MLYVLLGALFGVVGGMGLGGGIVLIPCLTLFMAASQQQAQGMTLFAYIPMAIFALISHIRQKNVRLRPTLFITAFGCVGGVGGYFLAAAIESDTLKKAFAIFLVLVALLRVFRQEIKPRLKTKKMY
ncbi:MAG: TSUP family transporter [Christensenellales bacterium]|jgi:uncharacterized membrane protein YfcA